MLGHFIYQTFRHFIDWTFHQIFQTFHKQDMYISDILDISQIGHVTYQTFQTLYRLVMSYIIDFRHFIIYWTCHISNIQTFHRLDVSYIIDFRHLIDWSFHISDILDISQIRRFIDFRHFIDWTCHIRHFRNFIVWICYTIF